MVRCKLFDPEPLCLREKATQLQFNQIEPRNQDRRLTLFQKLIGSFGERCEILSPFECDYGPNCTIGDDSFINRGAYLMDGAPIHISKRCFIGPDLGTYTARHPRLPKERDSGFERAFLITIGDNRGIGGDVTILPGVTIGERSAIGAKSLVNHDILAHSLAFGAPAKSATVLMKNMIPC